MAGRGRLFVVGSCNLDHVIDAAAIPRPGETVHGSGVRLFNGGKGANQAVAAARDRAVVILVGAVGADEGGESTLRDLCAEGVDVGHLAVIEGMPTGSAHIVVDPSGENCIVVIPGANARVDAAFVTSGLATLDGPSGDVSGRCRRPRGREARHRRHGDLAGSPAARGGVRGALRIVRDARG